MPGIVVGVDGSEASLRAVDWAAAEAARRGVGLTVFVAVYGPPEEAVLWTGPHMTPQLADQVMRRAAERARDAAAGVPVDVRTVIATPTRGLIDQAAEADLLVVGSRGLGAFTGLLVGSVSEQVAEHATCPVVVVRGESSNPNLPVLVGVDGSAANRPALEFAFAAADERHVGLVALATVPPLWITPPVGYAITPPVPHPADQLREAGQLLEQAVRPLAEKYPHVPVEQRPILGPAAHALIQASGYSSLLVVGSRGHGGLAGLLLGSVSRHVLRHAECPVAVVRS
jgi:nucleotide-binding universal stress UspA family protein